MSSAGWNSFFLEFDVVDDEGPFIFGNVLKLGIVGLGTGPFVRRVDLHGSFTPGPDLFVVNCLPSTHLAIGFGCAPPPFRGAIFKNEDASSFSGISAQHVVLSASALGIGGVGIRSFTVGFVPEPSVLVPEPSVLLLLGAGVGGWRSRRADPAGSGLRRGRATSAAPRRPRQRQPELRVYDLEACREFGACWPPARYVARSPHSPPAIGATAQTPFSFT